MRTLVFLEHSSTGLRVDSLGVLAKAAELGEAHAAILGTGVEPLAEDAGRHGAAQVYLADDPLLEPPLPQPRVDALAQIVRETGVDNVFFAQSVLAADVAAGLAARLEAGLNWQLVDVEARDGDLVGKQPIVRDTLVAESRWSATPRLALFRSAAFPPRERRAAARVMEARVTFEHFSTATTFVERSDEDDSGSSMEHAEVIVAGGRGLGGPEGFHVLEALAGALGGVVGATRPVVDAGWYPYSAQVGQTGQTVAPKLYIACGVSGAIQHKVGMQTSETIIAINTDPSAPIFECAHLAVVGDLHKIVPRLTEIVRGDSADGARSTS